jgi:hypothetical protein
MGRKGEISLSERLMVRILQESKKPMSLNNIIEVINRSHPELFKGRTPKNSLYSIIYRNEKKRQDRNEALLFNIKIEGKTSFYSLK